MTPPPTLAALCRAHHVARLWPFGSRLRPGIPTESDLDLPVEFEPGACVGLLALSRLQRELSALFGHRVDLVPATGLKPMVEAEVMATRELYAV